MEDIEEYFPPTEESKNSSRKMKSNKKTIHPYQKRTKVSQRKRSNLSSSDFKDKDSNVYHDPSHIKFEYQNSDNLQICSVCLGTSLPSLYKRGVLPPEFHKMWTMNEEVPQFLLKDDDKLESDINPTIN